MTAPASEIRTRDVLSHCAEIDSLRALAMIAVVAMHAKILPIGWAGVWLFFVISGYVVTLSIARNHDPKNPVAGATRFAWQRFGRIVPPYFGYLLVGLAISAIFSIPQPPEAVASLFGFFNNLAMQQGRGDMNVWPVGHLWTISVEMQFYAIYGLVAYFTSLAVTKRVLWLFLVLAPMSRFLLGALLAGGDPEKVAYVLYSSPGLHFDSFAMGCLFALARLTIPLEKMLAPIVRIGAAALSCYVFAYLVVNLLVRKRSNIEVAKDILSGILFGEGREVFLYTALGLASLALLALTVAHYSPLQRLTGLKVLQAIGRISYGGYIYHALCLRIASVMLGGSWTGVAQLAVPQRIVLFVIALGMTIVLAQISWIYLERPAIRLVRQRLDRRSSLKAQPASG